MKNYTYFIFTKEAGIYWSGPHQFNHPASNEELGEILIGLNLMNSEDDFEDDFYAITLEDILDKVREMLLSDNLDCDAMDDLLTVLHNHRPHEGK